MCLVALAWMSHPRWRLLLAGNRDEFHDRPSAALARWPAPDAAVMAGRDLRSGGTWLGVDRHGRVAVITNVRDPRAAQGGPSRGQWPLRYLVGDAGAAAFASGQAGQAAGYAPFNLLLADATSCEYLGNHPSPSQRTLAPGIHGLSNGPLDAPWPKIRHLRDTLRIWLTRGTSDPAPLWAALADEHPAPDAELPDTGVGLELERRLSPAFIRDARYGTRASTLVAIDHEGHGWIRERRFGPDGVFRGETVLEIG